MRYLFIVWMLLAAPLVSAAAPLPQLFSEPPRRVLFVGNSFTYFNNSLHNHLGSILRGQGEYGEGMRLRAMTISGGRLHEHAGSLLGMVKEDQWDLVIMQGHSTAFTSDANAEQFREALQRFDQYIRSKKAQPVLLMTWPYKDRPQMLQPLRRGYTRAGVRLDIPVVPVGMAFAAINKQHPHIDLYTPDLARMEAGQPVYRKAIKHPGVAGSYLAACVLYATLTGRSPQGIAYQAGLDDAQAQTLQSVAHQVVADFFADS